MPSKSRLPARLPPTSTNITRTSSSSKLASVSSASRMSKPHVPDSQNFPTPQWQLQIICGPGHDHNNFDSQRPGTKFKAFEAIGEQIWRPSNEVLDEVVQDMSSSTSLNWPDFIRFRVLGETTPWEHWHALYSNEHYGRKPLLRDCYLTHGWNKQSKTPIWLSREVKNFGTLRKILEKWFPLPKDKVTIIFEYINKDHSRIPITVPVRFKDLSIEPELLDHTLEEPDSPNSPSPSLHLRSSTPYSFPSSPPLVSKSIANRQQPTKGSRNNDEQNRNDQSNQMALQLISSSSSELPTLEQLIATSSANPEINKLYNLSHADSTQLPEPCPPSSPLSTIPDSPELHPLPPPAILRPIVSSSQVPPHRAPSKVVYILLLPSLPFFKNLIYTNRL